MKIEEHETINNRAANTPAAVFAAAPGKISKSKVMSKTIKKPIPVNINKEKIPILVA
tara:strand:+ start:1091 stop:1261 length:171 start_codon:yes stop_codon:yes gene_type:complete